MASAALLSLTHGKLHAHTADLTPDVAPLCSPSALASSLAHVAEGAPSGQVTLRDPSTLREIRSLPPHPSPIASLALAASYVAAGHADGLVVVHDLVAATRATFSEPVPIVALAFPPSARHLAALTAPAIALFSTVSSRLITRLTLPTARSYPRITAAHARFTAVAFSPVRVSLLAAADDTGCVSIFDITNILSSGRTHPMRATSTTSATHARFPSTLRAPASALSFARDGHLAVAGFDKLLRVFDPSLKQLLFSVSLPAPISALAFAHVVAVGMTDASIALVKLDMRNASGSIVKRVPVDAGVGAAGSRAVKAVVFPSKPKRRKPPRSATPLHVPSDATVEDMLAGIDDLMETRKDARAATPRDDDLFSPVKASPRARHLDTKPSSFHAPPTQRPPPIAQRSKSAQAIASDSHAYAGESRLSNIASESRSIPLDPQDNDPLFNDEVDNDFGNSISIVEESQISASNTESSNATGYGAAPSSADNSLVRRHTDVAESFRSYARTSPSVENLSTASQDGQRIEFSKSRSDVNLTPSQRARREENDHERMALHREVRFNEEKDVMLAYSTQSKQKEHRERTRDRSSPDEFGGDVFGREAVKDARGKDTRDLEAQKQIESEQMNIAGQLKVGNGTKMCTPPNENVTAANIQEIIKQEMDLLRSDLRRDILSVQSDMVVLAARQSQEISGFIKERDSAVKRLEDEIRRLRADNVRLRRKYGLG